MTIEDLKAIAQRALDHAIERIRESGELGQMFHLIKRDGGHEIIACGGDVTNSEEAKSELGRGIRARVQAGEIEAVIMISDTYIATTTREQDDGPVQRHDAGRGPRVSMREQQYFDALKRITSYDSPARLRRSSEKEWGLSFEEALEMAYESIQNEARTAIKGKKRPVIQKAAQGAGRA